MLVHGVYIILLCGFGHHTNAMLFETPNNATLNARNITTLCNHPALPLRMPRRPLTSIINHHKRPIHLLQPLQTILQRLRHIMRPTQPRLPIQHDIHLHPHPIPSMIRRNRLVSINHGSEAPSEESDFLENACVDGGTGEAGHVFDAGGGPVLVYEEGEEGGAEGVEPPEGELVAD